MGIPISKPYSVPSATAYPLVFKNTSGGNLEYGCLLPQGIYPCSSYDYDVKAVRKFIKQGLLAPFFIGVSEPPQQGQQQQQQPHKEEEQGQDISTKKTKNDTVIQLLRSKIKKRFLRSTSSCPLKDQLLYTDTVECPICLLNYPSCVNYTRCCDQSICTDCFLQLRRSSELPLTPVACPFCMQPNLGVIHIPPTWSQQYQIFKKQRMDLIGSNEEENQGTRKRRRKRLGPNDRNVILVDQVRPNWQDQVNLKQQRNSHDHHHRGGDARNRRRFSGSLSGTGTTRRIIVRPAMQSSLTATTM